MKAALNGVPSLSVLDGWWPEGWVEGVTGWSIGDGEILRSRLLDGRSEQAYLAEAERIGPYLTLLRGISFEQENIRWSAFALSVIDRRIAAQAE